MKHKTRILLIIIFFFGIGVSCYVGALQYKDALNKQHVEFEKKADERFNSISLSVDLALHVLDSLRFYYAASEQVDRGEFKIFVDNFLKKYSFIAALSWNRLVSHDKIPALESEAYLDGLNDFYVKEKSKQGEWVPVSEAKEHVVIYYIEPHDRNEAVIGFDVASNPDRLIAIKQAIEKRSMVATPRIHLAQDNQKYFGFLVFNPVYGNAENYDFQDEEADYLEGFVVGVFRIPQLLDGALSNIKDNDVLISVWDTTAELGEQLLYMDGERGVGEKDEKRLKQLLIDKDHHSRELLMAGRAWKIIFSPIPVKGLSNTYQRPLFTFGLGLLLTLLTCMFLRNRINQTAQIQSQVKEKTTKLNKANKRLKLSRDLSILLASHKLDDNCLREIMKTVCQYMEWSVGHIYYAKAGELVPSNIWHASIDESKIANFKKVTMETNFIIGEGLPGRVMKSRQPLWIADVTKDSNCPRAKLAKSIKVKSGMGFPIFESGEVAMVVEFYSLNIEENDDLLIDTMKLVSDLITRSIEIKNAQKLIDDQSFALDQHSIVAFTDILGRITFANDKFCSISKYSREELIGKDHRIINSGHHSKEFFIKLWKTIAGGNVWKGEIKNKAKDGTCYWVDTTIIPFLNNEKKPYQYVAIRTDITEKKEDELKLVEAMKSKSEFISMVSHELRTPLTVIKESVSLVHDGITGDVNANQKDFLATAKNNVDRLGRLINDVLDFQKLDSNLMIFTMKEQSINEVVSDVGKGFELILNKKNLSLRLELQEDLPNIKFDSDKIIQVVTNLMNNAMKFSDKGSIHLITQKLGDNAIKVSVRDEGIGIKESDLDKLFKSFSQIPTDAGRKTGGTGLGLVLCKKILEEHSGQIGVESIFGEGTTFYFVLPIKERRTRKA